VVIGKLAIACNEHLERGPQIFVEGRLRTRERDSNGVKGRRPEIFAAWNEFLGTQLSADVAEETARSEKNA